jgi:hypothetical protein
MVAVANITRYTRKAALASGYKSVKCWEGLEEIRLQNVSVRIAGEQNWQKREGDLPEIPMIIKDGSKYSRKAALLN